MTINRRTPEYAEPSTLGDPRDAATICRAHGWTVGTRLVGDEGYGPTVIEITAIGERAILAKAIGHAGIREVRPESQWCLACRDWKVA